MAYAAFQVGETLYVEPRNEGYSHAEVSEGQTQDVRVKLSTPGEKLPKVIPFDGVKGVIFTGTNLREVLEFNGSMTLVARMLGGNDEVRASGGSALIYGGAGNDTIVTGNARDIVHGEDDDDTIITNGGDDRVLGGDGNDTVYGGFGTDLLQGNSGDDELHGGPDDDVLGGGDGMDILRGDGGNDTIYANRWPGQVTVWASSCFPRHCLATWTGTPGAGDLLFGGPDNDTLIIDDGSYYFRGDYAPKAFGEAGNDILVGGDSHDALVGGSGNDFIWGREGEDYIQGGSGDDILLGDAGNDLIYGDDAFWDAYQMQKVTTRDGFTPTYVSSPLTAPAPVEYRSRLSDGNDFVNGGEGDDYVFGQGGADLLEGGWGNDHVYGGKGDDRVFGNSLFDEFVPWLTLHNRPNGATDDDMVFGGDGNDHLWGGADEDRMWGGVGNDVLDGGHAVDRLYGGLGDDRLDGGNDGEIDLLTGDAGRDTFVRHMRWLPGEEQLENESILDHNGSEDRIERSMTSFAI